MFPATFRTTIERGTGRLGVPFTITYQCIAHGSHKAEGWGMVDPGCPRTTLPMTMLPACVSFAELGAAGRFRSVFGDRESRVWPVTAEVLGDLGFGCCDAGERICARAVTKSRQNPRHMVDVSAPARHILRNTASVQAFFHLPYFS